MGLIPEPCCSSACRPVLVVPDGVTGNPGQRLVVAWKDTREARHAVQSALPYLRIAKHVALVEIAEEVIAPARTDIGSMRHVAKKRRSRSDRRRRLRPHAIEVRGFSEVLRVACYGQRGVLSILKLTEGCLTDQIVSYPAVDCAEDRFEQTYGAPVHKLTNCTGKLHPSQTSRPEMITGRERAEKRIA